MRNRLKLLKVFTILTTIIAISEIAVYIYCAVSNILTDENHGLELMFAFLTPTVIIIWAFLFIRNIQLSIILRNLHMENEHYLGNGSYFYNYVLFERRLRYIPKKHPDCNYYIMSFVPCNEEVTTNISRNAIMVKFNGLIANMVKDYFSKNRIYKKFDSLYCYHNNAFYLFVKGNEDRINSILRVFERRIYEIAKDNEIRIYVQPFFGVATYDKTNDLSIVLENAAIARLKAESNFELSSFYDENLRNSDLLNESKEIMDAIKEKEFVVYYQPKFSLDKHEFISSEALVRWDSKKYGFLNPSKFIEKAEKAGLIHEIDMYVFNRVCENLNELKRRGRRIIPVSINFSIYEFFSPNFVEDIVNIIDTNDIAHNLIEIEITETTTQSNPFLSVSIMKKLKAAGLRVLMDDFGVGFSNFSNLRKMPIDALKIDKSFIDLIQTDVKSREIAKFLIALGRANDLEVIAEGVDNKEQVEILRKNRLNTIQGYYYSKPLPFKEYNEFLKNNPFEKRSEA